MDANASDIRSALHYVDLGHCELAYRVVGSGAPLLMVHGYPLSSLTFRHIAPGLADRFTCYIPDLPGLGETLWTERTDFKFGAQAETLRAFIDAMGLSSYSILAHDTGATIARRLSIIDDGRVTAMVLIGTEIPEHRPPWIPFFQSIGNPRQTGVFKFLMSKRWFRHSSAAFGGCFKDLSLIEGEFFDLFIAPVLASDRKISGGTRFLLGIDWALVDALKRDHAKIKAPVLLVWGEEDTVFPVKHARLMAAQFGDCRGFVTVPGARLFVEEEKPEAITKIARDFLLNPRGASAGAPASSAPV
jgi:haloalkane dehalogenase